MVSPHQHVFIMLWGLLLSLLLIPVVASIWHSCQILSSSCACINQVIPSSKPVRDAGDTVLPYSTVERDKRERVHQPALLTELYVPVRPPTQTVTLKPQIGRVSPPWACSART